MMISPDKARVYKGQMTPSSLSLSVHLTLFLVHQSMMPTAQRPALQKEAMKSYRYSSTERRKRKVHK